MMKWLSLAVVFATTIAGFVNWATAADLNAPVERKITIETEIIRGYMAALDCNRPDSMNWQKVSACISQVISIETRQNTVTDPFKFGIYHHIYWHLWLLWKVTLSVQNIDLLKNGAFRTNYKFFYHQSDTLEKALGLSADDICRVEKAWGATKCPPPLEPQP